MVYVTFPHQAAAKWWNWKSTSSGSDSKLCALSVIPCCLSDVEHFLAYYPANDFDQT